MAMQPPREGDDVTDSSPGPAGAYSTPNAGALVTPPKLRNSARLGARGSAKSIFSITALVGSR